jgi:hypothetical protein
LPVVEFVVIGPGGHNPVAEALIAAILQWAGLQGTGLQSTGQSNRL